MKNIKGIKGVIMGFRKFILIIVCCSIVFGTSCDTNDFEQEKKLNVILSEYGYSIELEPAQMNETQIKSWNLIEQNPYYGNACYLSVSNENIVVSTQKTPTQIYLIKGAFEGYFVGVDKGEFDGWVRYYPDYSAWTPEIVGESQTVINENCRGFLKINDDTSDEWGYLFTTDKWGTNQSHIYKLSFPSVKNSKSWNLEKIAQLPSLPTAFTYDEGKNNVYIVTLKELICLSVENETIEKLVDLSIFENSGATSIVQINSKLYMGMCMGIYEYDLTTNESVWYPIDYGTLLD